MGKIPKTTFKFVDYVEKFTSKVIDLSAVKKAYVAVSGGADSMALIETIRHFRSLKVAPVVVHINYHTRAESDADEQLVRDYCEKHGLEFKNFDCPLDLSNANFEAIARSARYRVFNDLLDQQSVMFLGHHIDDSFEWHLMNQFKTSNPEKGMGIPVINNHFVRPFMCVSKRHILNFIQGAELEFNEDSSNSDNSFERNFVRNNLVKQIKKKFPKYLKHYVARANEWAITKKQSAFCENKTQKKKELYKTQMGYTLSTQGKSITHLKKDIKNCICKLSKTKRGKIEQQVDNLVNLANANKVGPVQFSGGVWAYHFGDTILFTNDRQREKLRYSLDHR